MEESVLGALIQSLAHEGPGYVIAIGVIIVLAWLAAQAMPMVKELKMGQLDLERTREERKDRESRERERHDRENAQMQGRWLEQQDRSNVAMEAANRAAEQQNAVTEGVRVQLEALNDNLCDSKEHSRRMGETMHTVASQVQDIHDHIVQGGKL